jgi:hypothetical protein
MSAYFEYRVMFRHYDGTINEYAKDLSEQTACNWVEAANAREDDTRQWWVERREISEWEKVNG